MSGLASPPVAALNIDWCEVPAGAFLAGSPGTSDNPPRTLDVERFLVARYPVTNGQYARFVTENPAWRKGAPDDEVADADYLKDWNEDGFPAGAERHPVAWVTWPAAQAFCAWASGALGMTITLPTEWQWEKAARGPDGRSYPWGEGIDTSRANFSDSSSAVGRTVDGRVPVGRFSPAGDSPYGCVDMAGNVWEWCLDWLDEYEEERVVRGGGWNFTGDFLRSAFRFGCEPRVSYNYIGFRCVATPR